MKIVYSVPSPCCDQFNILDNEAGEIFCAPAGGFTDGGHCTDLFEERENEILIWKDTRTQ